MPTITKEILSRAVRLVRKMDLAQRAHLLDEIHAHQPNLLYSALALRHFGAS